VYKTELLAGLAVMITKTKDELDMEYVNIGTNAETTIRAFPGLMANYSKHFEFDASKAATGMVLTKNPAVFGEGFAAKQPTIYTAESNPIQRANLCIVAEGGTCPRDKYEVKVSAIRDVLLRGSEYLVDFFDAEGAEEIFKLPGLSDTLKQIATGEKSKEELLYLENEFKDIIAAVSEDDVLDLVVEQLNSLLPKAGGKVFSIRMKTRVSSKGRHDWRTILEKGDGMKHIMEFVRYAKYLKYEAGEEVLREVEAILDASVQALQRAEEELRHRKLKTNQ